MHATYQADLSQKWNAKVRICDVMHDSKPKASYRQIQINEKMSQEHWTMKEKWDDRRSLTQAVISSLKGIHIMLWFNWWMRDSKIVSLFGSLIVSLFGSVTKSVTETVYLRDKIKPKSHNRTCKAARLYIVYTVNRTLNTVHIDSIRYLCVIIAVST